MTTMPSAKQPRPTALFAALFLLLLPAWTTSASAAGAQAFAVYRSTDAGQTWSKAGAGLPAALRIEALARLDGVDLAGTDRGLFVSGDGGLTWSRPTRGVPEEVKVYGLTAAGDTLYAATGRGVWRSTDRGQSWASASADLATIRCLGVTSHDGAVYAGTDRHGVWVLRQPGGQWSAAREGLPASAQVFGLVVHAEKLFAALYTKGIYRFDSSAQRWTPAGDERPLRVTASDRHLFAGRNPGGVFTTADGGVTWQDANAGLPPNAATWTLARIGATVLLGTAGPAGLLRWDDTTRTWRPAIAGLPRGANAVAFGGDVHALLTAVIFDR